MSTLKLKGSTSGYVELTAPATAGDNTITLPTTAGTVAVKDASGNLGIGSDSPTEKLDVVQDAADNIVAQFRNVNTNSGNLLKFTQLTNGSVTNPIFYVGQGGDNSGNALLLNNANTDMVFSTNNTERLRVLAAGGLTFNGDTAAANALDDYEEGSWTPGVTGQTTGTLGSCSGRYIKIGRLVFCTINFNGSNFGGTGTVYITGLPFTENSGTANDSAFSFNDCGHTIGIGNAADNPRLRMNANNLQGVKTLGSTTYLTWTELGGGSGTLEFRGVFTYISV